MINMVNLDEDTQRIAQQLASAGYLTAPKKRKPRVNWEARMIREWINQNYLRNLKWIRHEIGPYNPNDPVQYNGQLRRWADAIIDIDDTVLLVEAKMRPDHKAISQIDMYRRLFPKTPEFEYYWDKPLRLMLLTTSLDIAVKETCDIWGIEYEVFIPSFMDEFTQMIIQRYKKE
jgi:hypothetical protein